jgi:hypothetical protein
VQLQPEMSATELDHYRALLGSAETIVEFGSGGSTLLAVATGARVISVESDANWIARLRTFDEIQVAEELRRLTLIHVNVGRVGAYGTPIDTQERDNWPNYPLSPWGKCPAPDLVFVDGRFRVACIAQAVLHCKNKSLIVVHDFWPRGAYHETLNMLDWVSSVDTLATFKRRRWCRSRARTLFEKYKFETL